MGTKNLKSICISYGLSLSVRIRFFIHPNGLRRWYSLVHSYSLKLNFDKMYLFAVAKLKGKTFYIWLSGAIFIIQALKRSHQPVKGSFVSITSWLSIRLCHSSLPLSLTITL